MNATTTCSYSNPQNYAGAAPGSSEPFQFASSTCATLVDGSSTPAMIDGFTYGEAVQSTFLVALFILAAYAFIWFTTHGVKIRRN